MPKVKNRNSERLRFTVSSARTVRIPATDAPPLLPWPVAAIGGGLLAGLAGSLLVAGIVLVAWLSAIAIELPTVLEFAARAWLLGHGGELALDQGRITLVPLGLTAVFAALCASTSAFAFRQARQSRTEQLTKRQRRSLLLGTIGQVSLGYVAYAVLLAWTVAGPAGILRPALGALGVSLAGAGLGAVLASGWRPGTVAAPVARRVLRGAMAGALALVVVAAVVLGVALLLGETRIVALEAGLKLDGAGTFVWAVIALAYLPNLLGWALAWALGAGFTVGLGSLVSLSATQLGMLPAIPVLGALPPVGVASPWLLAWLATGVLAGVVTGLAATGEVRGRVTSAVAAAGLAGGVVGLAYLAWMVLSRGSLGELRLVGLGPRLLESLLLPVPLLLLSASLAGLVAGIVRRRRREG